MAKSYRYVEGETEYSFEIKHSKFIATVSGEVDADAAEAFVKAVRKKYSDATHNCYAYVSDVNGNAARFSDDGEPGGTAGQPILKVLQSKGLVRTAVVVTRYFGGIKLGAGGLVSAYTEAAAGALDRATVAEKVECGKVIVTADYSLISVVDRAIKSAGYSSDNDYSAGIRAEVTVPTDEIDAFVAAVGESTAGKAVITVSDALSEYAKIRK